MATYKKKILQIIGISGYEVECKGDDGEPWIEPVPALALVEYEYPDGEVDREIEMVLMNGYNGFDIASSDDVGPYISQLRPAGGTKSPSS